MTDGRRVKPALDRRWLSDARADGAATTRVLEYARARLAALSRDVGLRQADVLTESWGTPAERITEKVLALTDGREWHDIATLVAR